MSITDELREFANERAFLGTGYMDLCDIADRIDVEYQKAIRELNNLADTSILLPCDADGEPIHIGDMIETERFGIVEVEGFIHNAVAFNVYDPQPTKICTVPANQCRHYHALTVEDVLREFTDAILDWAVKSGTIVEVGTWSDVAAEYAAKLQLKED